MAGCWSIGGIVLKPIELLLLGIMNIKKFLVLDSMEYSSDANAQAAYVTNATEVVNQQHSTIINSYPYFLLGDLNDSEYREAQSFQLTLDSFITAVEIKEGEAPFGSPTGNWTLRIETDNANNPSGTLANVNASVVVAPPGANTIIKGTFAIPFTLLASTKYWLVINCSNQSTNNRWYLILDNSGDYANGSASQSMNGNWSIIAGTDIYFKIYSLPLQSYSEATIKTQGSYALKAVAAQTDSLNKTLTKTTSNINLSGGSVIRYDIYALRTGSNISLNIHDTGGTTSSHTIVVNAPNTWERKSWNISAIADADKDAIDQFYPKIVNADAANTFYIDNVRYK
jgi:hypothetical protein